MEKRDTLRHPEGSIYAKGYGVIAKAAMQDRRLSIEAKAIYAYMCSFAGAGETAFPSVKKICFDLKIDKKRYYNHVESLKERGYISSKRAYYTQTGKWANNVYQLNSNVEGCIEGEIAPYTHSG